MQLADDPWTGRGYELVRPCIPGHINVWKGIEDARSAPECWHYIHTLGDLIGGLCDAGFRILHLAERENGNASAPPGSHAHMAAYVQPFFSLYGQRCS
jgi:hypothetical protein